MTDSTALGAVAPERIRQAVQDYVTAVATGTGADIAALYSADGTVEDPVGTEPHRGRAAVTAFYSPIEGFRRETELLAVKVGPGTAAFHFRVRTHLPDQVVEVDPIDVMTFDADGAITSMRAFWSTADMTAG
jgi:steroid delta-isomerase